MLFTCYHLIQMDLVMELSWRYNLSDYTMPYMINHHREQQTRFAQLYADNEERKKKESEGGAKEDGPMMQNPLMITGGPMMTASPTTAQYGMTNGFGYQQY